MKNIVIVGAGNVGLAAARAVELAPDMNLCGFIRRKALPVPGFENIPAAQSLDELPCKPAGAIICLPSRLVEPTEKAILMAGVACVDAFDIHEELPTLRLRLDKAAKLGGVASVTGAGWDPGLDSVIRVLMQAALPNGITYTNFGPGMSMGHSVAARQIAGVENAISFTLSLGNGKHCRKIYAVLKSDADEHAVRTAILSDGYFEHDSCSVEFVQDIAPYFNTSHGVKIERSGAAAGISSQRMNFNMEIENPSLTASLMVAALRAALKMKSGCYFLPEVPPALLCQESIENLV